MIETFEIPLDEYPRRCRVQIAGWHAAQNFFKEEDADFDQDVLINSLSAAGALAKEIKYALNIAADLMSPQPSNEYGASIIQAMETGIPKVVYGNVMNHSLIDNLPEESCVEVPCLVDSNGIQPVQIGSLPTHLAALIQTNINVQALTVEAALTNKREHIYHAAMMDPHTAAELDLAQIWALVDDMLESHEDMLPEYH